VVPDASARSLGGFVAASVERGAIVRTDAWPGYAGLRGLGFDHRPRSKRALRAAGCDEDLVPRLHRAVSNLKSWLRGTHRSVSSDHLQVYLDELVFRFNRRGSPDGRFPELARARCSALAHDLRADHPAESAGGLSQPDMQKPTNAVSAGRACTVMWAGPRRVSQSREGRINSVARGEPDRPRRPRPAYRQAAADTLKLVRRTAAFVRGGRVPAYIAPLMRTCSAST
jgi:hypothetical protein